MDSPGVSSDRRLEAIFNSEYQLIDFCGKRCFGILCMHRAIEDQSRLL